eukprot:EG_transcript_14024
MAFLASLLSALMVLGNVLALAGAGAYLRRRKYIDDRGTAMLGRIVINVLLPCLLMTELASTDLRTMRRALGIPVFSAVIVLVAFTGGLFLSRLLDLKEGFRQAFVVGCAFGNVTSIPIVILTAVLTSYPSMHAFQAPEAIAYASLYMPPQHLLLFTLGYYYLAAEPDHGLPEGEEQKPLLPAPSHPNGFRPSPSPSPSVAVLERLNAPIIGIAIGISVALVPPLQRLWVQNFGPLGWLRDAVGMLGAAAVPVNMMCLGSNVSQGPSKAAAALPVTALCLYRFILMPLLGVAMVYTLYGIGVLASNRLILLTCLVEASTPTAINVVTIATALDRGAREISACLFWQYICFIGVQTLILPLFMFLVEGLSPI